MSNKDLEKFTAYPNYSIRRVMEIINENWHEIALIVDENNILIGVVTDGDIRRALLKGLDLSSPICNVMNSQFISVDPGVERIFVLDLMKANVIRQVPIVDENKKLVGIHFMEELIGASAKPNIAVIMAGGKGTRLQPLTTNCPKPMIPVAGRPILERIIIHLVGYGIRKIYISVNYLSHIIEEYFGSGTRFGCSIEYLKEDISLGTAGPLSLLPVKSEYPIIVLNGDLVTQVNIHQMLEFHNDNKFSATMGVKPYNVEIPYGIIKCENNRLMEILEKPMLNYLINAGIYVLNPNIFSFIPSNTLFSMDKLFETLINHDCSVGTYIIEEDWTDVGRHDEYKKVNGII